MTRQILALVLTFLAVGNVESLPCDPCQTCIPILEYCNPHFSNSTPNREHHAQCLIGTFLGKDLDEVISIAWSREIDNFLIIETFCIFLRILVIFAILLNFAILDIMAIFPGRFNIFLHKNWDYIILIHSQSLFLGSGAHLPSRQGKCQVKRSFISCSELMGNKKVESLV